MGGVGGAYKMILSRPTCVSWLLLASYAILLVVAGVGVFASVSNFWEEEPTPPPELENANNTTTTTLTTTEAPDPYSSRPTEDPRLYVLVPCAVCVVVAASVLVVGLWSRQFFSFTFSLYNSMSMLALTFVWAIMYQVVFAWKCDLNLDPVRWVFTFHVILMYLLSAQILLSVWELRRQQAGWPTVNWRSVFTVEAMLVTARVTLTVYTILILAESAMLRYFGVPQGLCAKNIYGTPCIRYQKVLILISCGAACYNAVATMETTLSILLGKLHTHMTTITSLMSGLCCATITAINSPVFMRMVFPVQYINIDTMYFASALSVVTFLHVIACLGFSSTSRSPPSFINTISNSLVSTMSSLGNATFNEQRLGNATFNEQRLKSAATQSRGKNYRTINFISALFSFISIATVAQLSPSHLPLGSFLVICANFGTLVRTLPAFISEFVLKETDNASSNQRLIAMSLECSVLLVGVIVLSVRRFYYGESFAGVINLPFFFFQIYIILQLLKEKCIPKLSERTESLVGNEEISSEGNNDEQNPNEVLA